MKLPGKEFAHCCEDYIVRLIEEIVGKNAFQAAKESLNRRLTSRERLLSGDPRKLVSRKEGTIELMLD